MRGLCCWVAWPRLACKECLFTDTGRAADGVVYTSHLPTCPFDEDSPKKPDRTRSESPRVSDDRSRPTGLRPLESNNDIYRMINNNNCNNTYCYYYYYYYYHYIYIYIYTHSCSSLRGKEPWRSLSHVVH